MHEKQLFPIFEQIITIYFTSIINIAVKTPSSAINAAIVDQSTDLDTERTWYKKHTEFTSYKKRRIIQVINYCSVGAIFVVYGIVHAVDYYS